MDRPILREQTPAEYFKELVDSALARQHVQAGDLTSYYLVNLLCQFVRLDGRSFIGGRLLGGLGASGERHSGNGQENVFHRGSFTCGPVWKKLLIG